MSENDVKSKITAKQTETKYSKTRLLASEVYKKHRDLLSVLLDDEKQYTREETNDLIDKYLKGKVN